MSFQFHSESPLYLQIANQLRNDILAGVYPPDSQIPPVRQLAFTFSVNPNTIQRAVLVLESEGLLYTMRSTGHFVTSDKIILAQAHRAVCRNTVRQFLTQMKALGIEEDELRQCLAEELHMSKEPVEKPETRTDGTV